jgi:hypothetical protein
MQISLGDFTLCPVWGEPPGYQLLAEPRNEWSPGIGESLTRMVDDRLQKLNCEYRDKRQTSRLAEMKWLPLPKGTWNSFSEKRQQNLGGSLEQYKHPCLVPDMNFSRELIQQHVLPKADHSSFEPAKQSR